jgi:glycosyltransferase involved in cell wall biosynthesis
LRLLVATPFLPHPSADHGGGVYLAALLRALAERCDVELVSMCRRSEVGLARDLEWFTKVETVAVPRVSELTPLMRALDQARLAYLWGVRALPLLAAKMRRPAMARALGRALERRPDAALLEFAVMAQYLPYLRRRCPTVLTDHERGGHAAAGVLGRRLGRRRDERLWRRYVRRFYPLADLLQTVNPQDARIIGHTLEREVAVRPLLVELPADKVDVGAAPPRALFLGDYAHHPNAEAAVFVAQEVWPTIRAGAPGAELWLAGPRAPAAVRQLERLDGVRYVGFVADLRSLFATSRLLLAPVLSGDGSRVKVVTAAAHGLPVVANQRALSGIDLPPAATRAGESKAELAAQALALLLDADAARAAGDAARLWAESNLVADSVVESQLHHVRTLVHSWRAR